jgi:hypothetical protein
MRLEREGWRRWGLARIDLCGCAALGFKAQAAAKQDRLLAGRGPPLSLTDSYISHTYFRECQEDSTVSHEGTACSPGPLYTVCYNDSGG